MCLRDLSGPSCYSSKLLAPQGTSSSDLFLVSLATLSCLYPGTSMTFSPLWLWTSCISWCWHQEQVPEICSSDGPGYSSVAFCTFYYAKLHRKAESLSPRSFIFFQHYYVCDDKNATSAKVEFDSAVAIPFPDRWQLLFWMIISPLFPTLRNEQRVKRPGEKAKLSNDLPERQWLH